MLDMACALPTLPRMTLRCARTSCSAPPSPARAPGAATAPTVPARAPRGAQPPPPPPAPRARVPRPPLPGCAAARSKVRRTPPPCAVTHATHPAHAPPWLVEQLLLHLLILSADLLALLELLLLSAREQQGGNVGAERGVGTTYATCLLCLAFDIERSRMRCVSRTPKSAPHQFSVPLSQSCAAVRGAGRSACARYTLPRSTSSW